MNKKYVLPSVLFLSIYGATVTTWAEESAVYDVEGNTNTAASPTGKGKFNFRKLIRPESNTGGVSKSMLTLNEAIIDVKKG